MPRIDVDPAVLDERAVRLQREGVRAGALRPGPSLDEAGAAVEGGLAAASLTDVAGLVHRVVDALAADVVELGRLHAAARAAYADVEAGVVPLREAAG